MSEAKGTYCIFAVSGQIWGLNAVEDDRQRNNRGYRTDSCLGLKAGQVIRTEGSWHDYLN
jgi:hypothetical protein